MTVTADPPGTAFEGQSRLRRLSAPLAIAGGLMAASVALHLRDPHQAGSWGFCPWLVLTGTHCPGCGGLRAVNNLTRGEIGAAASSNLLLVSYLPVFAVMWGRSVLQRWRGVLTPLSSRYVTGIATFTVLAIVVFWVVRNLPAGSWLAP